LEATAGVALRKIKQEGKTRGLRFRKGKPKKPEEKVKYKKRKIERK
jgi:hypothetical protein